MDRRAGIILEQGSAGLESISPLNDALHELKAELNSGFPSSESESAALFADLQSHLEGLYLAEKEAVATLAQAGFNVRGG